MLFNWPQKALLLMTEHNYEEEARRQLNNIGKTISEYYSRDINRNFYC